MHFWIDKRSAAGQCRASSAVWCRPGTAPKLTHLTMAAPVHRYPSVSSAADTTSRRLGDPTHPPPLTTAAYPPSPSTPDEPPAPARLSSPEPPEVDCLPCCCVLSVTVMGVLTLTAAQMYLEHILHQSASYTEMTGVIFLFVFLFVCLLFFARLLLILHRRGVGDLDHSAACSEAAALGGTPVSSGEPPPYEEAVRLPVPPLASPPPDYDKVRELGRL